jgi:hypothetical protein
MPDAPAKPQQKPHTARLRATVLSAFRALRALGKRLYALALAATVAFLGYHALRYLVEGLVVSHPPPRQVTGVPLRMDETLLHGDRPSWTGLSAVETPRSPLSHYHRFDTWVRPDRFNDCARSGCHSPAPHARRKEDRAFLNMHAASMHCGVCHMKTDGEQRPLTWYDLDDGRARGRPALLDAYDWLQKRGEQEAKAYGATEQREIAGLLATAAEEGQGEPHLQALSREISAVRAGSEALLRSIDRSRDAVSRAMRGSYGSKLALQSTSGKPILGHPDAEAAVRDWLARGKQAGGDERERMLRAVHTRRRETPLDCTACHTTQNPLIDFAKTGYPAARVRSLTEPQIFEMIQHIREGRQFHIPTVGAPMSQPTPAP